MRLIRPKGGEIRTPGMKSQDIPTTEEREIRALIEGTVIACQNKDAAALTAQYAEDVVAFDLINPMQYAGADAVAQRATQWFSSWEGAFTYEIHDLSVTASGDTGFCHSLNHVKGTQTGGQAIDMWWRATVCCRKTDGKWWVTHLHSSVPFDMETGKASLDLKP
ncbi:ketosteroid isomerase [Brevifollis gellanilyticus]|uniref:Ketosteroid isomerase n=2 Tax=Brevifollis gellanilyticus TaxID=748831 RepID=A0A512MEX5_9BACT|nr:ketosteroid isomerase [Brevifollis gellanilyticus]